MPLGVYEKETTSWLEKHMKPDTIFYDIGANAGYFTLLGSQNAFRTYSFEPIPINVEVIKNHISENAITNVEVIPVALTDQVGIVRFVVASKNANSHLEDLDISHGFGQGILSVEGTTVDEFTKGNSPPSLLKIDVEGAELKVLEGARKCISEYAPDIILSTHSKKLKEDCRNFLQGLGYTVSELPGFVHELVATHNNNS
ncbi:MAG: FkbM family methyltransferase [Saprospiraceae bacterium]|nr:FkbM family methyltransferase [Saprospiraceae bacterium]